MRPCLLIFAYFLCGALSIARADIVTARLEMSGTAPLNSAGYVASGNSIQLELGFEPQRPTELKVIDNTGREFIEGTFANLPQGAAVTLVHGDASHRFVAWYHGGDGNDLVLIPKRTGLAGWGTNTHGQIGDGARANYFSAGAVDQSGALAGKTLVQVARGLDHTLALDSDGVVYSWGGNSEGQLGDGSTRSSFVPLRVGGGFSHALSDRFVVALSAGAFHSLALCADGSVVAWGRNIDGQLGDGTNTLRALPVLINGPSASHALAGKQVVALSAGQDHSLALCADGSVAAWGGGSHHQLGDGANNPSPVPVAVSRDEGLSALAGKEVKAVSAGGFFSLALCTDGTVASWGKNQDGQLGDGSSQPRSHPVAVDVGAPSALAGRTVVAVSAGYAHALALCADGTLAAWGRNASGELGDNSTTLRNTPVGVLRDRYDGFPDQTIMAIAAGWDFSTALTTDGATIEWGVETWADAEGDRPKRLAPVAAPPWNDPSRFLGHTAGSLAAGGMARHSIVRYFGPGGLGGLGLGPVFLPVFSDAFVSGTIHVFELGYYGDTLPLLKPIIELTGESPSAFQVLDTLPASLSSGERVTFRVAMVGPAEGRHHANLRVTNGEVSSRDIPLSGYIVPYIEFFRSPHAPPLSLGNPRFGASTFYRHIPYWRLPGLDAMGVNNIGNGFIEPFPDIANGATVYLSDEEGADHPFTAWYHGGDGNDLVLLQPFRSLMGWGANESGQLGSSSISNPSEAVAVDQSHALRRKTIVQIVQGFAHSLALSSEGKIYAWGSNDKGQLGIDSSSGMASLPTPVSTSPGSSALAGKFVVRIAAGRSHSLAYCSDGTLAAWGDNASGELGDGSTVLRRAPVAVDTGRGALAGRSVTKIAAGTAVSFALCADGAVVAWGSNENGRLGNGTDLPETAPVLVARGGGASALSRRTPIEISAGGSHALVLCSDSTIVAWGGNAAGQLGDGTTQRRLAPVEVQGAASWEMREILLNGATITKISAGGDHSLALLSDGSVLSWGGNEHTQLGGGTDTLRPLPAVALYEVWEGPVTDVSAGLGWSTVLFSNGTARSWGTMALGSAPGPAIALSSGVGAHGFVAYSLTAFPPTPFELWQQAEFGSGAGTDGYAAPLVDPDQDGLVNLLEYAFRSDPNTADTDAGVTSMPLQVRPDLTSAYVLTFPYRASASDLSYRVLRSTDLGDWQEIYRTDLSTGTTWQGTGIVGEKNEVTETIAIRDSATGARLFWRIAVDAVP
jgi:alpha-tubulin suppressor-like RCC1 family protein